MVVLRHSCFVDVDTASASKCTCRLAQDAPEKSAHSHNISDMVAEQRGYTPWMGEEPKDGVGLVKTIPRKRPQRRRVEMSVGLLVGSAASLEHPPLGGSGWDGTTDLKENVLELEADDLDEKIINDGVKVKRFKVRAWGGVHMSQSGQENPGAQCGDKDSDIGRIDDEERVVKDWRHTQRSNVKQRGETGVDAI